MSVCTSTSILQMLARPSTNIGMQDTGTRLQTCSLWHPWWWSTTTTSLFLSQPSWLMATLSCLTTDSYMMGPSWLMCGHFMLSGMVMTQAGLLRSSRWLSFLKVIYSSHLDLGVLASYPCLVQSAFSACSYLLLLILFFLSHPRLYVRTKWRYLSVDADWSTGWKLLAYNCWWGTCVLLSYLAALWCHFWEPIKKVE